MGNDASIYYDDSYQLDSNYQGIMDWSIWFYEYRIRHDLNKCEDAQLFASSISFKENMPRNADSILHTILEKKKLFNIAFMTPSESKKQFFDDNSRTAIDGDVGELGLSNYDIGLNQIIVTAGRNLKALNDASIREGSPPKFKIVALNFMQPLNVLQQTIEELWLIGNGKHVEADIVKFARQFNKNPNINSGANNSRAVGLWIWDYMHHQDYLVGGNATKKIRVKQKEAIDEFRKKYHLGDIGLDKFEDTDLRFLYRKTKACIELAEVLPFTKNKKGTKKEK